VRAYHKMTKETSSGRRHHHRDHGDDDKRKKKKKHSDEVPRSSESRKRHRHEDDDKRSSKDSDRKRSRRHRGKDDDSASVIPKSKRHKDPKHSKRYREKDKKRNKEASTESMERPPAPVPLRKREVHPEFPLRGVPPDRNIHVDADYYRCHKHFNIYLRQYVVKTRNSDQSWFTFEDFDSTSAAQEYFQTYFVPDYNAGNLPTFYYQDSIPPEILDRLFHGAPISNTSHSWSFSGVSAKEQQTLLQVQSGVHQQTEFQTSAGSSSNQRERPEQPPVHPASRDGASRGELGGKRGDNPKHFDYSRQNRSRADALETRADPGTHERRMEAKQLRAAKIHGAARSRDDAPELDDTALYGSCNRTDDLQAALQKHKEQRAHQEQQRQERIQELQSKEQARQQAMLAQLGLTNVVSTGQKIKIAPRPPVQDAT
jgi:hypothetical protein